MYLTEYSVTVNGETVFSQEKIQAEETIPDDENREQPGSAENVKSEVIEKEVKIGVYSNGYDYKRYISLRDLASALNGTDRQYNFRMDPSGYTYLLEKGVSYEDIGPVMVPKEEPEMQEGDYHDRDGNLRNASDELIWTPEDKEELIRPNQEYLDLYLNPLLVDGQEVRYYSYQLSSFQDLYMDVLDIQLMLGITITLSEPNAFAIKTDGGYLIDLDAFEQDGYFDLFNGVVLGDATTGEILYGCKENNPDAIASTSKLMTYMVVSRYMEMGKLHMDDEVTLSENTAALAQGWYGTIYMEAGQKVTVHDLIAAMMIQSSNEAALALAEYTAGSEEEFVRLMNDMAELLELKTARFYNAHGLPDYSDSLIASTRQNRMSVADLFRLSAAVLRKYPEVLEFTAAKSMYLETLGITVNNTSYLLYNMEGAIGLKTGTTDEAGCCLVGAVRVPAADGEHILVAVVIGALSNLDRYQIPEVLLTWGEQKLLQVPKASVIPQK